MVWNAIPSGSSSYTGYRYEVRGLAPFDADGDAIADVVDADGGDGTLPGQFHDAFADGTIGAMPAGWFVAVTDAPGDEGVRAVVNGTGPGKATIVVCGYTVKLTAGTDLVLTCASVIAKVAAGVAEVVLDDGASVVSIPAGSETEVDTLPGGDGFTVEVLSGEPASIVTAQGTTVVEEGDPPTSTPGDAEPPVVTGTPDRAPNSNGWYSAPVTITWSAVDPAPSSGLPTTPAPTTVSTYGAHQSVTSAPSCDPRGNCATGTVDVSIDGDAPVARVIVPLIVLGLLGQRISGTAGDATSGVDSVVVTLRAGAVVRTFSSANGTVVLSCGPLGRVCSWRLATAPIGIWAITAKVTDKVGRSDTATASVISL